MAAMSIGSTAMQHQQASMQAKMQTQMYHQNRANSITALSDAYTTTGIRAGQEAQAASEAVVERNRQAMMQAATANVAAGEAGVTGISVDRIMGNILGMAGRDNATTMQNLRWTQQQLARENVAHRATAINRINSVTPGIKPNALATAFQIGAAGLNAYTGYTQRTGNTPVEDWWARRQQGADTNIYAELG
jgi:hypothetical protein